jgi:hypothetical protein
MKHQQRFQTSLRGNHEHLGRPSAPLILPIQHKGVVYNWGSISQLTAYV